MKTSCLSYLSSFNKRKDHFYLNKGEIGHERAIIIVLDSVGMGELPDAANTVTKAATH